MVTPLPSFIRNWFYGTMLVAGCQYFGMGNKSTPYILSLNAGVLVCLLFVHFFKPEMMPDVIRDNVSAPANSTSGENQNAGSVDSKSDKSSKTKSKKVN